MKPAVFRPAARSRSRWTMARRTSAWVPLRKMRPEDSVYLSSSVMGNADIPAPQKGCFWGEMRPAPGLCPWRADNPKLYRVGGGGTTLEKLPLPVAGRRLEKAGIQSLPMLLGE